MKTEFFKKNIELLSILLVLALFLWNLYPLSNTLTPLDSSDFSAHIFKVHYISENGMTGWNSYWYGGFPFMKQYPPLSYMIVSSVSNFGLYLSYTLIFDIVLLLIPISIYIFVRTFKMTQIQRSLTFILVSLSPATLVFFRNSNLPFITSFLFSILFLTFFKKSIKNNSVAKPIILLTAVLFTHVLMAIFLYISAVIWFFSSMSSKTNIHKFLQTMIIPALLASVWYLPFSQGVYSGREGGVSVLSDPLTYTSFTANQRLTTMGIPKELFYIFGSLFAITVIFSFTRIKEKTFKNFFPWLVVSGLLFIFLDYKRIVILMAIPLAFLASLNMSRKYTHSIIILLVISNILIFSTFTINFGKVDNYPKTGNRVIFYDEEKTCDGCSLFSAYMPFLNGDEIINGWLPQSQNTNDLFEKRAPFLKNIQYPLNISHDDFNTLAKASMVNYVAISKNSEQFIDYFRKNTAFKFLREDKGFVIFDAVDKFSFIEINNGNVNAVVTKSGSDIIATFNCSAGKLTIKETYDKDWKLKLDEKKIESMPNKYGFIESEIDVQGPCTLEMEYKTSIF